MNNILHKRSGLLFIGVVAALLLGVLFAQGVRGSDPDWAPDGDMMARGPIADRQTVERNMAAKEAIAQREEEARQAARNGSPGTKDPNYRPPAGDAPEPVPTGILDNFSLPSGWSKLYRIKNVWQQFINGDRVVVYAGSRADDPMRGKWGTPEQGVIVVMVFPTAAGANPTASEYLSPTKLGALSIRSAQGTKLTLTPENRDATFTFDVSTRNWTTSR